MKKAFGLFVIAIAISVSGFAQTPAAGGRQGNFVQHRVTYLTTLLSLSSAQAQQATAIFTNAAAADASVHSSMAAARQALKTAEQANDAATIEQTATAIGNLTAQTTLNQAKAEAAFFQILTPAQQTKLAQFESESHGPMGPGGFRGRM